MELIIVIEKSEPGGDIYFHYELSSNKESFAPQFSPEEILSLANYFQDDISKLTSNNTYRIKADIDKSALEETFVNILRVQYERFKRENTFCFRKIIKL